MNRTKSIQVLKLFAVIGMTGIAAIVHATPSSMAASNNPQLSLLAKQAFIFEPNKGQLDQAIDYSARGDGYTLYLTNASATLFLTRQGADQATIVNMQLIGSNKSPTHKPFNKLASKSHYLIGNDANNWQHNIPHYSKVRYAGIYPGIDIVYYGHQQKLEYDFIVSPGADPGVIRLSFDGVEKLELDEAGNLKLSTGLGQIIQHKPVIYQQINGQKKMIDGEYRLLPTETLQQVGFQIAAYDKDTPLIIDPVISYATYLAGNGADRGNGIDVDASGNIYVTGDFSIGANQDAFVSKFDANGALVYTTYLSGSSSIDFGNGIVADSMGNAYIIGSTNASDFPTLSPIHGPGGSDDVFIAKLNTTGTITYSTRIGGASFDNGRDIAIDSLGNAYITGGTSSNDFPTQSSAQPSKVGISDAFIAKLNMTSNMLEYSTFLGGNLTENGKGIAVDSAGNAYVTGTTSSDTFPVTAGVFQAVRGGMSTDTDSFIIKYDSAGSKVFASYLGGSSNDIANGIAIDSAGNSYITGDTSSDSSTFPFTTGAYQTTKADGSDVFLSKVNSTGTQLVYSTYLGGSSADIAHGIVLDIADNPIITGETSSNNFPTIPNQQTTNAGTSDIFVTKFNSSGNALLYSMYIGGSNSDRGLDIALGSTGNAYITGSTGSGNFPTTFDAFDDAQNGSMDDAFVVVLGVSADVAIVVQQNIADPADINTNLTYTISVTNNGPDVATGVVVSYTIPTAQGLTYVSSSVNQGTCSESNNVVTCSLGTMIASASTMVTADVIVTTPGVTASITNSVSVAANETDPVTTNNTDTIMTNVQPGGNKPPVGGGGGGGGGGMLSLPMASVLMLLMLVTRRRTHLLH